MIAKDRAELLRLLNEYAEELEPEEYDEITVRALINDLHDQQVNRP